MELLSSSKAFGGSQRVYRHQSSVCACPMSFAIFLPPQAEEAPVPVLWYLSGLTCSHQNVMDKGEYRAAASANGIAIICPDTSPRGPEVPDEPENWQFGGGAGFYLDATQAPYDRHYRMESYVRDELPALVAEHFPLDMERQGIFGHSMGGHGAITLALKNPGRYGSVSAFAPISQPMTAGWSRPAFEKYLGADEASWRAYDSTALIADGHRVRDLLVDQGTADGFLQEGLRPWLLEIACAQAGIPLELTMREGYDHSYNFVSTFMAQHIAWHAQRLKA
ncbi:S-formylglutathione hydrolase [Bosea sp. Leaf344]|uniref:S-formylglutathione hydrolase n=1 Tax=Bosea sp. Leaf344 TaxID=1736346 RepID=UPI0006F61D6D|nr:S-formylglutathione hydrolase [Bosea sp. Leaf344]KQU50138.1 S-formylglutathione hydrolase [Bosea sp. Leaf344]